MKKNALNDLLVLDFGPQEIPEQLDQRLKETGLCYLYGCTRRILIGKQEQLNTVADDIKEKAEILHGVDAYDGLLQFVAGIRGKMRGETQVTWQFKQAWQAFERSFPEQASRLNFVYQDLLADNTVIRNNVTPNVIPAFYECAAHALLEQKQGQTILVVVGPDKNGTQPSEITKNIVKKLGNDRSQAAGKIIFTCPDRAALDKIYNYFNFQKGIKKITCEIEKMPFNNAFDCMNPAMHKIDACCICYPMGLNEEADKRMIEEWGQREAIGNCHIVHMGGPEKSDRHSNPMWRAAKIDNLHLPEDISAEQTRKQQSNDETIETAKVACRNCALSRQQGKFPIRAAEVLTLPPQEYMHRIGLRTNGTGRAVGSSS